MGSHLLKLKSIQVIVIIGKCSQRFKPNLRKNLAKRKHMLIPTLTRRGLNQVTLLDISGPEVVRNAKLNWYIHQMVNWNKESNLRYAAYKHGVKLSGLIQKHRQQNGGQLTKKNWETIKGQITRRNICMAKHK